MTSRRFRKGDWSDGIPVKWVQKVENFVENFRSGVSGAAFEFDGVTPRLSVNSGRARTAPFSYTITQGVEGGAEAVIRINNGTLAYHLPDDVSGADRYFQASDMTADCTISVGDYNVVYASWTIASTTYSGAAPVSGLVVATTPINGATELAALQGLNSSGTVLKFPILCVSYNATTHQATLVNEYNVNAIYSVSPVAGIGP